MQSPARVPVGEDEEIDDSRLDFVAELVCLEDPMATPPFRTRQSEAESLRHLLKSHYLADEFPGVLTTANFADFCAKNLAKLPTIDELLNRIMQCAPTRRPGRSKPADRWRYRIQRANRAQPDRSRESG
jgi:hypothetical protein